MPKIRWIAYQGRDWRLHELAAAHHLRPQTLASRLERGLPLDQALSLMVRRPTPSNRGYRAHIWTD